MARKSPFATLIGDKQLVKKLDDLEKKYVKRSRKAIARAGAAVYKRSIKREVPVDEGDFKKSIDFKITKSGAAVIGPDADYVGEDGKKYPKNYAHLVEYGHVAEDGSMVAGQHPIQRGATNAESAAAEKMVEKAKQLLEKYL